MYGIELDTASYVQDGCFCFRGAYGVASACVGTKELLVLQSLPSLVSDEAVTYLNKNYILWQDMYTLITA